MRLRMLLGGAALAASASLPLATAALAVDTPPGTPPDTGCAASFELLEVADLVALGYMVPTFVDEEIGNNDGLVCGKPFPDQVQENFCEPIPGGCSVPIVYSFRDNDLPYAYGGKPPGQ
jgi:hypothetical protein